MKKMFSSFFFFNLTRTKFRNPFENQNELAPLNASNNRTERVEY